TDDDARARGRLDDPCSDPGERGRRVGRVAAVHRESDRLRRPLPLRDAKRLVLRLEGGGQEEEDEAEDVLHLDSRTARSISLSAGRRFRVSRLSWSFVPRARARVTFASPRRK